MASAQNASAQGTEDQKLHVGKFTYIVSKEHLDSITDKIGNILEAQVILRGEKSLGYGYCNITTSDSASAGEGDITGNATVRPPKAGRGREKTRGTRERKAGRVRKSADDVETEGTEALAQNGQTSVTAVTEGVSNLNVDNKKTRGGAAAGRGGKNGVRAPRPKKERGEPSKTLVFIRNLPYSYTEENIQTLFSEAKLSYQSVSIPTWKFGVHKGKGRGYAFATVDSEDTQKKVIESLNGKEITSGPAATEVQASGEGNAEKAGPRTFRLAVRQGYENDLKEASADEAAPAGNDSGTAENQAAAATA